MKETKAYTVAVGNLSMMPWMAKNNKKFVEIIKGLDGFIGVHPVYPHGTLLLFDSENNAKRGRNILKSKGIKCGDNICECFIPNEVTND